VGYRGSATRGAWLFVALLLPLLLVLVSAVDLDGDPSTPNVPDAVLVAPPAVRQAAVEAKPELDDGATPVHRPWGPRVVHFVRRAERWTVLLRRFHRSVLTDIPI